MARSGSSASTTSSSVDFGALDVWIPIMELLFHVRNSGIFGLCGENHAFFVILPLMYSVTRRGLTIPLDALSGTVARAESLFW